MLVSLIGVFGIVNLNRAFESVERRDIIPLTRESMIYASCMGGKLPHFG